jgi:DNA replication and repair protein RecF
MTNAREVPQLIYQGCDRAEVPDYEDLATIEAHLFERLCKNHEREIGAGATLYGVHKDDIEIILNEKDARSFASQGQQRSLSLALKLAEGELCREDCGEYPVFLFDDVLSELDFERRKYILSGLYDRQIIITSCSDDEIKSIADRVIEVKEGRYVSSHR